MILRANSNFIRSGLAVPLQASGGTAPYTYSVAPGGAGGTINPSTGVYQAPQGMGQDTIIAEDSLEATASLAIGVVSPLQIFCEILRREMGLSPDQVYIYNQKFKIPTDLRLYISVGILSTKVVGSTQSWERRSINLADTLSINLMSKSFDALTRRFEIVHAMQSEFSKQQQTLNGLYVSHLTQQFTSLSEEDGAAIPYRFNTSAIIMYSETKNRTFDYYDQFEKELKTEE